MRAIVCEAYGPPDSLTEQDLPVPEPKGTEVRVRVTATGLGFVDGLMIQGLYQVRPPLPYRPGSEFAGVVDAVGPDCSTLAPGDRVFGNAPGALADFVCTDAARCFRTPDALDNASAASLVVNYPTALYGLRDCANLEAGETVLVLGASGGVGLAAIATARAFGARVVAAASTDAKRAVAKGAGANATVDYTQPDWRDALRACCPDGLNVVCDPVGGDVAEPAFRSLSPGGRFLVIGFAGGTIPRLPLNLALLKRSSIVGVDWGGESRAHPELLGQMLGDISTMIDAGTLKVAPVSARPATDYVTALEDQLGGRITGKLVLIRPHGTGT